MSRVCIVGAGFSGAVLARCLAEAGHDVLVTDERPHIAGNCHTERDPATGIMIHRYGPHIFHTADAAVWDYVCRFAVMQPFVNRVKATAGGRVYSLPINLHTINQFFDRSFSPDEARAFLAGEVVSSGAPPANFEEQALSMVGEGLYRTFFRGYTRKQWGMDPRALPASLLKRLPMRFSYDDNYFSDPFQGIPRDGYTAMVAGILQAPGIELRLGLAFESLAERFRHVFYSGPLDRYFDHRLGRLRYRTLRFEEIRARGDFQGTAVMNYCDESVPFTRINEAKHFAPWEAADFADTVCFREYSGDCGPRDIPYYPVRLAQDAGLLGEYVALAERETGVSFLGRLGTYRYLDMDKTIGQALRAGARAAEMLRAGVAPPVFFDPPLG